MLGDKRGTGLWLKHRAALISWSTQRHCRQPTNAKRSHRSTNWTERNWTSRPGYNKRYWSRARSCTSTYFVSIGCRHSELGRRVCELQFGNWSFVLRLVCTCWEREFSSVQFMWCERGWSSTSSDVEFLQRRRRRAAADLSRRRGGAAMPLSTCSQFDGTRTSSRWGTRRGELSSPAEMQLS